MSFDGSKSIQKVVRSNNQTKLKRLSISDRTDLSSLVFKTLVFLNDKKVTNQLVIIF